MISRGDIHKGDKYSRFLWINIRVIVKYYFFYDFFIYVVIGRKRMPAFTFL